MGLESLSHKNSKDHLSVNPYPSKLLGSRTKYHSSIFQNIELWEMEVGKGQIFAFKELLEMIHSFIHSFIQWGGQWVVKEGQVKDNREESLWHIRKALRCHTGESGLLVTPRLLDSGKWPASHCHRISSATKHLGYKGGFKNNFSSAQLIVRWQCHLHLWRDSQVKASRTFLPSCWACLQ